MTHSTDQSADVPTPAPDDPIVVLLVDDQIIVHESVRVLLSDHPEIELHTVSDPTRAVDRANSVQPTVILQDLNMPQVDGLTLIRFFRANPATSQVPLIVLSSQEEPKIKANAFALGATDYLIKLPDAVELVARIKHHSRACNNSRQRQRAEGELKAAKKVAEEASRSKSAFLATMSHEFRTPLNAILGFTELLIREDGLTTEQNENLRIINRSGEHLLELINDVLEMSKIEAGYLEVNDRPFDLRTLLSDLEQMFELRARDKGLELSCECEHEVPRSVVADEAKLRQVLINLMSNAVKFTSEGQVRLRTSCRGKDLVFAVEDTGPGVDLAEIDTLFEAFEQSGAGKQARESTGLGLSISRRFARMLGGDIAVHSDPGRGAVFTLTIELKRSDDAPIVAAGTLIPAVELDRNRSYRILVVGDRWEDRKLLVKIHQRLGCEIRETDNGAEAIRIWETWSPDLVWLDLWLHGMSEEPVARHIQQGSGDRKTPVIALTASGFGEDTEPATAAGCVDLVRKPFRENDILEVLSRHLGVGMREVDRDGHHQVPNDAPALNAADFAGLEAEWLRSLRQAAYREEADQIAKLIDELESDHHSLFRALRSFTASRRFDRIIAAMMDAAVLDVRN